MSTGKLVLLRHGQSIWNLENLFTGWIDVDLSAQGLEEAKEAGRLLKAEGIPFDLAFTSVLKRAIRTLWITLDELDMMWLPVERSWRLNERHYGALQGLDKAQTVAKHGAEQVKIWRRSYDIPPPPLDHGSPAAPALRAPLRRRAGRRAARVRVAQGHAGARAAVLERAHRARARGRPQRAGRRARQQPARDGEDARRHERRRRSSSSTSRPACRWCTSSMRSSQPVSSRYLGDAEAVKARAEAVARQAEAKK